MKQQRVSLYVRDKLKRKLQLVAGVSDDESNAGNQWHTKYTAAVHNFITGAPSVKKENTSYAACKNMIVNDWGLTLFDSLKPDQMRLMFSRMEYQRFRMGETIIQP